MDRVRARVVAEQGQAIPADVMESLRSPLLLDAINDRWQKAGRGVTVEALLELQDTGDDEREIWHEVGPMLSERLLSLGTSYGLYVWTADLPFDVVLSWVRTATANKALALADLTLTSRPHVSGFQWNTEEVRCSLLQRTQAGSWIGSLWTDTVPGNFFYPDLVLAIYAGDVTQGMAHDTPLSEALFSDLLSEAVAWLIPYGDPPLFLVGLPPTSALHRDLTGPPPQ